MPRFVSLILLACACALLAACGPTQSTIVINEAEVAVERARLSGAEERAPYEYFSATEYLHKAKEEWGYSDFEAALDYASLSKQFAEEAKKKVEGVSDGLKPKKEAEKKEGPDGNTPAPADPADELEGLE